MLYLASGFLLTKDRGVSCVLSRHIVCASAALSVHTSHANGPHPVPSPVAGAARAVRAESASCPHLLLVLSTTCPHQVRRELRTRRSADVTRTLHCHIAATRRPSDDCATARCAAACSY